MLNKHCGRGAGGSAPLHTPHHMMDDDDVDDAYYMYIMQQQTQEGIEAQEVQERLEV